MKKILLFSRDPGAANCIAPIYKKIVENELFEIDLFGKDMALDKYKEMELPSKNIQETISFITLKSIKDFLNTGKYNLVCTGTGFEDFTDRLIWKAARELGIKSIAILDHWINYHSRFTFDKPGELTKKSEIIYPDIICVMDKYAEREMIKDGIPQEKIVITGQPYFNTIIDRYGKIDENAKNNIRTVFGIGRKDFIITFASEPLLELYADPLYYGYNEFTILDNIIKALDEISLKNSSKNIVLIIRLHPKNKRELFDEFIQKVKIPPNIKIVLENNLLPQELIAVSNIVIGMMSMFLIETAILEKPYASIQINRKTKEQFILGKLGISKTILSFKDLMLLLENSLRGTFSKNKKDFLVIKNASERILEVIEKLI